jgi:transcriptional regulator with XRE-family HTH domain
VSIGDALAEARRQAGLTITQVSQRTCIRETIIRGIERNDFSACGGDFYARGHIRSIARAVGTDPEPLIREYDATQGAPEQITAADVFEPSTPIKLKERRRPNWSLAMLVVLALIVGVATYHFLGGPAKSDPRATSQTTSTKTSAHHAARHHATKKTDASTQPQHHKHRTVIVVSATTSDCWVYLTTTNYRLIFQGVIPAGTSKTFYLHHKALLRFGDPQAVTLKVNGKTRSPGAPGSTLTIGRGQRTAS